MKHIGNIRSDVQRLDKWSNGVLDAIEAGDLARAERLCNKLTRHYPDQIDGHHRLALVREAQGRWNEAVKAYDEALAVIGRQPDAFDDDMAAYLREGRETAREQAQRNR